MTATSVPLALGPGGCDPSHGPGETADPPLPAPGRAAPLSPCDLCVAGTQNPLLRTAGTGCRNPPVEAPPQPGALSAPTHRQRDVG